MTSRVNLDSLEFTRQQASSRQQKLAFNSDTMVDAKAWQRKLRTNIVRLIGGMPRDRVPLSARIVGQDDFSDYHRETILFNSRDNLTVFAYFLMPKGVDSTVPAIVCCPGHGRGCDDIVGIEEDGSLRESPGGYQNDFALQAVRHGFAALAIEPLGFGHRRDETARNGGAATSSCQPAAGAALLLGETMVGWRVYDVIRSLDYLQTRPEVDPKRLGCMGISDGGTTTFFASALDRRIKASLVSGYFNSFQDSIFSIPHCIDNYVPGILNVGEMSDVAGLIAPRPLFVESGTRDPIFPVAATLIAFDRARKIYDVFDARDRLGIEIFEGDHRFHGVKGFSFLKKWLYHNTAIRQQQHKDLEDACR